MGYQSVNELEQFSFEDCRIKKMELLEDIIRMEMEALIVLPFNSQNTNFTESYAGDTVMRLLGAKVTGAVKEGYRYFNANGVLLEQVPDEPMSGETLKEFVEHIGGAYFYSMKKTGEKDGKITCALNFEVPPEEEYEDTKADIYRIEVEYEKLVVNWERFLNRVQKPY